MDALLINPTWLTKNGNIWHGVKSTSPPLGLLYVAAAAEAAGARVAVLDMNAERLRYEDIQRFVLEHKPRFVGFTAVTAQVASTQSVARLIKNVSPQTRIVVGGVHATAVGDEVISDPHIDYLIRGEGERSFVQLLDGAAPEAISGLSYRDSGGAVVHNEQAAPITDLDSLPAPAYHLIKFDAYEPAIGSYRRLPSITMTMTRGCPGKCTFCTSASTPLRTRSAENVVAEIQQLQARYGIREVNFYDDTFTVFKKNVMQLCDLLIERGIDITWSCFARADCVSEPLLAKMRRAGCHQILFGIESADPQILANVQKPIDIDRTTSAVRMVKRAGITVRAAFMFGSPGETVATMQKSIDYAIKLAPDIALFNITTPYPGTKMYDWAKVNGYLRSKDWADYDLANAVMDLPTVSAEQVNRMYRAAYRQFYFRFSYLLRRLTCMRSWEDIKCNVRALRSVMFAQTTKRVEAPVCGATEVPGSVPSSVAAAGA